MNLRAKTAFGNSGQAPDIYCIIQGGDANENGGDYDVDEDGVEDRDDPQKAGEDGGDGSPCYFEAEILEVVVEKHGASKSKM